MACSRGIPGTLLSAKGVVLSKLSTARGPAAPVVSLSAPSSAAPGARVALDVAIDDEVDSLNAFTAEVLVDGVVVQSLDSRLPEFVDLPLTGAQVQLGVRVRDLAGNVVSAQQGIVLADDGLGPALIAVRAPAEVLESTWFDLAAVPADPARVAQLELSIDGAAPVVLTAPAFGGRFRAPVAGVDRLVTIEAVAIDAAGRRGAAIQSPLWVRHDLAPAAPAVALQRVGSGAILEGVPVKVLATVSPSTAREVVFRIGGVEQARVGQAPFEASLLMPLGQLSRSVTVEAVALDLQGRESAPALLTLTVVDDLTAPTLTVSVLPPAGVVAAGSTLIASATGTDAGAIETITQRLEIGGTAVAVTGALLEQQLPRDVARGPSSS